MTTAVAVGAVGDYREPVYKGVLYRVCRRSAEATSPTRSASAPHKHRQKRMALGCAEMLAAQDGAPQV